MFIEEAQFERIVRLLEEYEKNQQLLSRRISRQLYRCQRTDRYENRLAYSVRNIPWEKQGYHLLSGEERYPDDSCDECTQLEELCTLVDCLVNDIVLLEEEMVRWRAALYPYLSPEDADCLRSDIFDNLAERHTDEDTYQLYLRVMNRTTDPMESEDHLETMKRLRDNRDETSIRF
ncbi:MAG: hypothetical protein MJ116_14340 [Lachnospiraceae bacterium]|nr:hypothetical protein [Lachnospiraceae bacterium]